MRIPGAVCNALAVLGAVGLLALIPALPMASPEASELAFALAFVVPLYATGVFAYRKRPDLPIARLLLAVGSLWAIQIGAGALVTGIFENEDPASELWPVGVLFRVVAGVAFVLSAVCIALLPDGLYRREYERWFVRAMWLVLLAPLLDLLASPTIAVIPFDELLDQEVENPLAVSSLSGLAGLADTIYDVAGALPLIAIPLLGIRYRRLGSEQRLQVRWPLFVLTAGVAGAAILFALAGIDPAFGTAGIVVAFVAFALLPASIVFASFRYRLLDVDLLIRKSLVYGALWLVIALTYVGAAAALGIAAGERLPVALAVLLTVVATLVFQPARRRLEGLADRWVFGERLSRYELLTGFGAELERTLDPNELLPRLVETVRRGLDARWSRVLLRSSDGTGVLESRAAAGTDPETTAEPALSAPLRPPGEAEPVGRIECGPKREGTYTSADRSLLENLARQASLAIENAGLATELATRLEEIRHQAAELAASRARIVHAQEAERRRIERNIHDGAQQTLVALIAKLRLARNQLDRGGNAARATLGELQDDTRLVLDDLRQLAQGIHPSVLSDSGLLAAIETRAGVAPSDVRVKADRSVRELRFADEIEGAAYFVASEGLANALKHAAASSIEICLSCHDELLTVSVIDNGAGFEPSDAAQRGLADLQDRVAALGGTLRVRSRPAGGTTLECVLPAHAREMAGV